MIRKSKLKLFLVLVGTSWPKEGKLEGDECRMHGLQGLAQAHAVSKNTSKAVNTRLNFADRFDAVLPHETEAC